MWKLCTCVCFQIRHPQIQWFTSFSYIFLIIRWFILGDVPHVHVWNSMCSIFFGCIAVKPLAPEEELQDDEETKELIMQILQRIAPWPHQQYPMVQGCYFSYAVHAACSKRLFPAPSAQLSQWLLPRPNNTVPLMVIFVRSLFQGEGLTSHWYKTLWQLILTCSLLELWFDRFCSVRSWSGNDPKEGIRGKAEDICLCRSRVSGEGERESNLQLIDVGCCSSGCVPMRSQDYNAQLQLQVAEIENSKLLSLQWPMLEDAAAIWLWHILWIIMAHYGYNYNYIYYTYTTSLYNNQHRYGTIIYYSNRQ